ncbi:MAG: hypothetical protein WCT04_23850 [Planctomycetota bacterium]
MKPIIIVIVLIGLLLVVGFSTTTTAPTVVVTTPTTTVIPVVIPPVVAPKPEALVEDNPPAKPGVSGSLKGVAKYNGPVPIQGVKQIPLNAAADCKCNSVPDESLIVDPATSGLKWVVIRIMDITPKNAPPLEPAYTLTQKGCRFSPHIVTVPPGVDLNILNPDGILHNIHTTPYDSNDPAQNFAVTKDALYKGQWLKEPDLIEVKCDVHGWMKAFILCHDPRYCAISDTDGTFEIKSLPPGKYKVNIWHESFGNYLKQEAIDVEIKAGAATDMGELKFAPKK